MNRAETVAGPAPTLVAAAPAPAFQDAASAPEPATGLPVPAEPLWVLRINPLRRSRLCDAALASLLADLAEAEQATRRAATACTDELYRQIGATTDRELRGRLIAVRRDVHNDREPGAVPPSAWPAIQPWQAERQRRRDLREQVVAAYPQALRRERANLADLLGDEHLRSSLALVAPEVDDAAGRYQEAVRGEGQITARARKSERGLIQYVTRAMMRTSPLSRFTAVGIAVPDPAGPALDQTTFDGAVAFPGLDRVMLGYVLAGLQAPAERADITSWVQIPPTASYDPDGTHLYFLRPTESGMQRMSTRMTTAVRLLLGAAAMGPRQVFAIAADIAAWTGCSPADAARTVLQAVRAGILCTATGPEDASVDFDTLLTSPDPAHAPLLTDIRHRLPKVASAPAGQRRGELDRLRADLTRLSLAARRPAAILVEEDYLLPPRTVATTGWRRQLDDLAAGVELLALFDRLHDVRALLTAVFVERFGAGANVPLAEHAAYLTGEVYRRGGAIDGKIDPANGPADGSLARLHALRREVTDLISQRLTECQAEGSELTLTAAQARDLVRDMPERFRADPLSYGVLVQPWQGRLVFNDAYAGHGILYGRFLGADRALGGRGVPYLASRLSAQYGADGARVVEDAGLHRLNVNAHVPILPKAVRPDDWFRLRLAHDRHADRLVLHDADGRPLRVLTLGAGHPELVPPPLLVAVWLVSAGRLLEPFIDTWHRSTGWDRRQTRTSPRLAVGSLLLARRRWYPGEEFAAALAAGDAGEPHRLVALTEWRARHGVCAEVMVKTVLDDEYRSSAIASGTDLQAHRRRQKPQYVDLTSALNVRVLPRLLDRRSEGHLEEALPAVADGPHATEWIVEIARSAGGRFEYGGPLA